MTRSARKLKWRQPKPLRPDRFRGRYAAPPPRCRPGKRRTRPDSARSGSLSAPEWLNCRGRLADTRHAEADTAWTLPSGVRVPGAGPPVADDIAVGDEVMRRGGGDRCRDDVARAHLLSVGREMHQAAVSRAPAHPRCAAVLAAFPGGHQQFDGPPDLVAVLLQRDLVLQCHQSLIALLHNGFGQLTVQFGGRGAGALGVLEGERP